MIVVALKNYHYAITIREVLLEPKFYTRKLIWIFYGNLEASVKEVVIEELLMDNILHAPSTEYCLAITANIVCAIEELLLHNYHRSITVGIEVKVWLEELLLENYYSWIVKEILL
jgi:hypothetical protein